jgi:hypothetical protein
VPLDTRGRVLQHRVSSGTRLGTTLPGVEIWYRSGRMGEGELCLQPRRARRNACRIAKHPLYGACALAPIRPLPGFRPVGGAVMRRIEVAPVLFAGASASMSCVDTEYADRAGMSLQAAILLDASHPGAAPAALPGMRALSGPMSVFEAPGPNGTILARRLPRAWLIVQSGPFSSVPLKRKIALSLLTRLHATVTYASQHRVLTP